jgi:hypothetical protein
MDWTNSSNGSARNERRGCQGPARMDWTATQNGSTVAEAVPIAEPAVASALGIKAPNPLPKPPVFDAMLDLRDAPDRSIRRSD